MTSATSHFEVSLLTWNGYMGIGQGIIFESGVVFTLTFLYKVFVVLFLMEKGSLNKKKLKSVML